MNEVLRHFSRSKGEQLKALIIEEVIENTVAWNDKVFGIGSLLSPKALEAQQYIMTKTPFNCRTDAVREITSLLLDEDLNWHTDAILTHDPTTLIVVIPMNDENGHNYPLGDPTLRVIGRRGITLQGRWGNNLSERRASYRPATQEDIDLFFDRVPFVAIIEKILGI